MTHFSDKLPVEIRYNYALTHTAGLDKNICQCHHPDSSTEDNASITPHPVKNKVKSTSGMSLIIYILLPRHKILRPGEPTKSLNSSCSDT